MNVHDSKPTSWFLNTVDRASRSYGWTTPKKSALLVLAGIVAWLATFVTLTLATGLASVLTLSCLAVGAAGIAADYIAGGRQDGRHVNPSDGDWWCPECVANHPGPGTCVRCDITLVHGHLDKEQP